MTTCNENGNRNEILIVWLIELDVDMDTSKACKEASFRSCYM